MSDRAQYLPVPPERLEAELATLENFLRSARKVYYLDRGSADAIVSMLAELQRIRK